MMKHLCVLATLIALALITSTSNADAVPASLLVKLADGTIILK